MTHDPCRARWVLAGHIFACCLPYWHDAGRHYFIREA